MDTRDLAWKQGTAAEAAKKEVVILMRLRTVNLVAAIDLGRRRFGS
jgi:hypothetical protein